MKNPTPIILLVGKAGSGKDTVGEIIAKNHNAVTLGQADPMKRLVHNVFSFTEGQLWGPSELRNATIEIHSAWDNKDYYSRFQQFGADWADELLNASNRPDLRREAINALETWFWHIMSKASKGPVTLRYILMTLGTECLRSVLPDIWVNYAIYVSRTLLAGGKLYSRNMGLITSKHPGFDYAVITDGRFRNEVLAVNIAGGISVNVTRKNNNAEQAQKDGIVGHASETEQDTIPGHFFSVTLPNDEEIKYLPGKVFHLVMNENFKDSRMFSKYID